MQAGWPDAQIAPEMLSSVPFGLPAAGLAASWLPGAGTGGCSCRADRTAATDLLANWEPGLAARRARPWACHCQMGRRLAEMVDPIALTRSLNAAVLLVPSLIEAKLTETATERQTGVTTAV